MGCCLCIIEPFGATKGRGVLYQKKLEFKDNFVPQAGSLLRINCRKWDGKHYDGCSPSLKFYFYFPAEHGNALYLELAHGGHLGFYEGGLVYPNPVTWLDQALVPLVGSLALLNADTTFKTNAGADSIARLVQQVSWFKCSKIILLLVEVSFWGVVWESVVLQSTVWVWNVGSIVNLGDS